MPFDPRPLDKRKFKSTRYDIQRSFNPSTDSKSDEGEQKIQIQEQRIQDIINRILKKDTKQAKALQEQLNLLRKED